MIEFYEGLTNTQKEIFMVIAESDSYVTAKNIYESLGGKRLKRKGLYPSDKAFLEKLIELGYVIQSIEHSGGYIPRKEMEDFANYPFRICIYVKTVDDRANVIHYLGKHIDYIY